MATRITRYVEGRPVTEVTLEGAAERAFESLLRDQAEWLAQHPTQDAMEMRDVYLRLYCGA